MRLLLVVLGMMSHQCFAEPTEESIAEAKAPKYVSSMQKDIDAKLAKANHANDQKTRTPAAQEHMDHAQRF